MNEESAEELLDGLDVYTIPAMGDAHELKVYGIQSKLENSNDDSQRHRHDESCSDRTKSQRRPILLLHGRTWSAVPVYHLLGGPNHASRGIESHSLMEALYEVGLQPYSMDFRGFGGTAKDESGNVEPNRCVLDAESVLSWIAYRHKLDLDTCPHCEMPALLGWSQVALVAQLVAQKAPDFLSKLVLYGSIYDPQIRYPRAPLYTSNKHKGDVENTFDDAIEDFTIEGTIHPEAANLFARAALICDPIKAKWTHLHQFNNCDPGRVHVPTLVIAGDQDPYAPLRVQSELFTNLGRGADRTWSILSDADHAVHLLDGRNRFVEIVKNFVENGTRGKTL